MEIEIVNPEVLRGPIPVVKDLTLTRLRHAQIESPALRGIFYAEQLEVLNAYYSQFNYAQVKSEIDYIALCLTEAFVNLQMRNYYGGFFDWVVDAIKSLGSWFYKTIASPIISWIKYVIWPYLKWIYYDVLSIPSRVYTYIKPILDNIINRIRVLFDPLLDAVLDAANKILQPLFNIAGTIRSVVMSLIERISSYLGKIASVISSAFNSFFEKIRSFFSGLWNNLINAFGKLSGVLSSAYQHIAQTVQSLISAMVEKITQVVQFFRSIPQAIANAFQHIAQVIHNAISRIIEFLSKIPEIIKGMIPDVEDIRRGLSVVNAALFFGDAILVAPSVIPGYITFYNTVLESGKLQFAQYTTTLVRSYSLPVFRHVAGISTAPPPLDLLLNEAKSTSWEIVNSLFKAFEREGEPTTITTLSGYTLDISKYASKVESEFEQAKAAAINFVAMNIGMSYVSALFDWVNRVQGYITGWGLRALWAAAEVAVVGGEAQRVVEAPYWALGIGFLGWQVLGGLLRAIIGDSLESYYRFKYRTKMITRSEVDEWLRTGYITEEQAAAYYAQIGYKNEYIPYLIKAAYKKLSLSYIVELGEYGVIKLEEVPKYVVQLGYEPEVAALVAEYVKYRIIRERYSGLIARIGEARSKGYLTKEQAEELLVGLGLPPTLVNAWVSSYSMDLRIRIIDELVDAIDAEFRKRVSMVREEYEKGIISEEDYYRKLGELEDLYRDIISYYIVEPDLVTAKWRYILTYAIPTEIPFTAYKLEDKIRDLEFKLKSIESQIEYLEKRRKETLEAYEAQVNYYFTKMSVEGQKIFRKKSKRIDELRKEINTIISVAEEEYTLYGAAPKEVLEARLKEVTERARIVGPELRLEYDVREDVLRIMIDTPVERRLDEITRYIEEVTRERREMIKKLQEDLEAELSAVDAVYAARIAKVREDEDRALAYIDARLRALAIKAEEYRAELEAAKAAYERLRYS